MQKVSPHKIEVRANDGKHTLLTNKTNYKKYYENLYYDTGYDGNKNFFVKFECPKDACPEHVCIGDRTSYVAVFYNYPNSPMLRSDRVYVPIDVFLNKYIDIYLNDEQIDECSK